MHYIGAFYFFCGLFIVRKLLKRVSSYRSLKVSTLFYPVGGRFNQVTCQTDDECGDLLH